MSSITLISLLSFGHPDLGVLSRDVEGSFHMRVDVGGEFIDPGFAYNRERGQYLTTPILERLAGPGCGGASKILGITDVDLFIPILTYVFGEAELGGRAGIVSMKRLGSYDRLLKEAKHEIGHLFGLVHCRNMNCVLYPSTSADEVDQKGSDFCVPCRKILRGFC